MDRVGPYMDRMGFYLDRWAFIWTYGLLFGRWALYGQNGLLYGQEGSYMDMLGSYVEMVDSYLDRAFILTYAVSLFGFLWKGAIFYHRNQIFKFYNRMHKRKWLPSQAGKEPFSI